MLLFQNIRPIAHDQIPSPEFTYFHYKFNWTTSQVTEPWKENSSLDGHKIMHEEICIFINVQCSWNNILPEPSPYIYVLHT